MTSGTPVAFHRHCATGVLHVHTTRSDGRGEPGDIVRAGIDAGLQYIAFNDHRTLALMDQGWHGRKTAGLLTIVGCELEHTDRKSHLLVYGVDSIRPGGHILRQLEDVRSAGGIAIIAHPAEKRPHIPGMGEYPWTVGTDCPVNGVEGWNWMSMWKRGVSPFNLWRSIREPDKRVLHPSRDAVDIWYETGGCLVGGADAHGHRILGKDVFNYRMLFDRVRTHILTNEPLETPEQFTDALRNGRCFISNNIAGDASGYRSAIHEGSLFLKLPGAGGVRIRGRSEVFLEAGVHCLGPVTPPVYLEVHRRGRTWIAEAIRKLDK